jgi:hypothetical protein
MVKPAFFPPPLLKVLVLNAENLFVFMERWDGSELKSMKEPAWQLSNPGLLDNKPLVKTLDLAHSIKSIDPDLILMTEVGGLESLKNFNQHFLENGWRPHLLETNSDRGIDMGYLVRGAWEATITSHRDYVLPHAKYTKFSRDVLSLKLAYQGETWLVALLVHLKSKLNMKGEDFEGRTRRAVEVHGLAAIASGLDPATPLLVGGDFNGDARWPDPEPEFLPLYHRAELKDVVELSHLPEEDRFSYLHFRPSAGTRIAQQLDYLFMNPAAQQLLRPESVIFPRYLSHQGHPLPVPVDISQKKLLPSDHFPLYAEFDLTRHPLWRD